MDSDLAHRHARIIEPLEKRTPSTSRITNSSWIGTFKNDPPNQIKSRYPSPLPSNIPLKPIPQANNASSVSAKSFYSSLPKKTLLPFRPHSLHDGEDHLKLYRPAPPWSTLNEHLTQVQVEETAAIERLNQHRRTIPPEDVIARVDMSSTKATLIKRQLDEWTLAQTQIRRDEKVDVRDRKSVV